MIWWADTFTNAVPSGLLLSSSFAFIVLVYFLQGQHTIKSNCPRVC